jgi:hypothetical protein
MSLNKPIYPTVQGRMKEFEYIMMSRGRTCEMPGSSAVLFSGRRSLSLRPRGSHSSSREGYDLVMSLKSHGMGEGPMGLH